MLWTTDRRFAARIIGPESGVEKEYLVRVSGHEGQSEAKVAKAVVELQQVTMTMLHSYREATRGALGRKQAAL